MIIDVVNEQNEKVDSLELSDDVFGGRINTDLIWASVVRQNASERQGTHATKTRGLVSGTGKKPWKQKGTGRAQVGDARNPLWRKGGTVFGPQPRNYDYAIPRKAERGALRAALSQRMKDGAVVVIDALASESGKTKAAAELLARLGVTGKTIVVDVHPEERVLLAMRNLAGVRLVPSNRLTARDVIDSARVVVTRPALERLQEVLS